MRACVRVCVFSTTQTPPIFSSQPSYGKLCYCWPFADEELSSRERKCLSQGPREGKQQTQGHEVALRLWRLWSALLDSWGFTPPPAGSSGFGQTVTSTSMQVHSLLEEGHKDTHCWEPKKCVIGRRQSYQQGQMFRERTDSMRCLMWPGDHTGLQAGKWNPFTFEALRRL